MSEQEIENVPQEKEQGSESNSDHVFAKPEVSVM
jgi:hypothetical protein